MINFFYIILFLGLSSQNSISSLNNLSQNSKVIVPSDWTRIVQLNTQFCLTYRKNYEYDKINHAPCDSYDDYQNWKFIANKDGSYKVQLKSTNYFLTNTNKYNEGGVNTLAVSSYPIDIVLVQSQHAPELFSLRSSSNQNLCFESQNSKFSPCNSARMGQLYFFDTKVTPPAITPNIFYGIGWENNNKNVIKKCLGRDFKSYHCSDQNPEQAFKFIPTNDGSNTYYIINGVNDAVTAPEIDQSKRLIVYANKVKLTTPDPKSQLQKFKVLRSPFHPERFYMKLASDNNFCFYERGYIFDCPQWEDLDYLTTLSIPCGSELVKPNIWYFLRTGEEYCLNFNTISKKMNHQRWCQYEDHFLFKFEYDEQNKSYYIYNKSQGNKVLTVTEDIYNNPLYNSLPTFEPKNTNPARKNTQSWNTTTRYGYFSLGFELINRYTQYSLQIGFVTDTNVYNHMWADAVHSEAFLDGPLASVDNSKEYFDVPKMNYHYCPATYFHEFN